MSKDEATESVDTVLRELTCLAGFDHWWDAISEPDKAEIRSVLIRAVLKELGK